MRKSPVRVAGGRLHLTLSTQLDPWRRVFGDAPASERARAATALSAGFSGGLSVLVGAESPLRAGRSVVALLGSQGPALDGALRSLGDADQAKLIQGELALLSGGQITSYRVGATYTVGTLPFWLWPSWCQRARRRLRAAGPGRVLVAASPRRGPPATAAWRRLTMLAIANR